MVVRQGDASSKVNQARIAKMNCHTLNSDVRVKELQHLASNRSIGILAVQEHRCISRDMHKSLLLPGWQFLQIKTPSTGVGRTGFLQSPCAKKALLFFFFPSHRIGKIALDVRDRRFHVFCVYAPTAVDHHRAECRTFHGKFSPLVDDISLRDHIMI